MVDQHLETTFKAPTALNVSGVQDTKMSPRDRSPVRNPSHTQPLGKKNTGTSWDLTIWLCCSWNKLLVRLARGELAPQQSLASPKVFSPFCCWWSFGSLPLSPLTCLVVDTSFPAISSTWLHRYYLNRTELDDAITEFNNEMPLTENWVFNLVILHYWHYFPILILCSCFVTICIVKRAIWIKVTWLDLTWRRWTAVRLRARWGWRARRWASLRRFLTVWLTLVKKELF